MNWIIIIGGFIMFWVLRGIYFYSKFRSVKKYHSLYIDYVQGKEKQKFTQVTTLVADLFKEANLNDFVVSSMEPAGYGYFKTANVKGFINLHLKDPRIMDLALNAFNQATGVFRHRMIQSFNPLYWIEFIIKLPEKLLEYLNFKPGDSIMKIFQLIYWIAGILFGLHKINIIDINSWY
jgi:hypothetical protein